MRYCKQLMPMKLASPRTLELSAVAENTISYYIALFLIGKIAHIRFDWPCQAPCQKLLHLRSVEHKMNNGVVYAQAAFFTYFNVIAANVAVVISQVRVLRGKLFGSLSDLFSLCVGTNSSGNLR